MWVGGKGGNLCGAGKTHMSSKSVWVSLGDSALCENTAWCSSLKCSLEAWFAWISWIPGQGVWQPVAGCGKLWRPVAGCGMRVLPPISSSSKNVNLEASI